jgi:hypothetical protein
MMEKRQPRNRICVQRGWSVAAGRGKKVVHTSGDEDGVKEEHDTSLSSITSAL